MAVNDYAGALHIRSVRIEAGERIADTFPFNLPIVRAWPTIEFTTPVTFFVGENGSGKSTLLEAMACAIGSITAGAESVTTDKTLEPTQRLARQMRLSWTKKTRKGLFLRAEDFFGYAKRMAQMRAELEADLRELEDEYAGRSAFAKGLAQSAIRKEIGGIEGRYGKGGLDSRSHGESFLQFFQTRFTPNGLYLLDEPEAPLSPLRQLALLALLKDMVAHQGAQFIIATHSPILMAFPDATILECKDGAITPVAYDELEHVRVTRDFLNSPQRFLQHL